VLYQFGVIDKFQGTGVFSFIKMEREPLVKDRTDEEGNSESDSASKGDMKNSSKKPQQNCRS
jgi:hypothetical protein